MAYLPDDEEQQRRLQAQQAGGLVAGNASSAAGPAQGQPGAPANAGGSGFVNLQTYLGLNQGAAQGMANKLAGGVQQQAQAGQDALAKAQSGFGADVAKNTYDTANASYDPSKRAAQAASFNANAGAPNDPTGWQTYLQNLSNRASEGYKGPTDFTQAKGYSDAATALQGAQDQAGMLGNQSGRQALLAQQYGRGGNYTTGQSGFDSFLVGGTPGAASTLQQTQAQYGGIRGQLGTASDAAAQQVKDAQAKTAATQRQYQAWADQAQALPGQDAARKQAQDEAKKRGDAANAAQQTAAKVAQINTPWTPTPPATQGIPRPPGTNPAAPLGFSQPFTKLKRFF